MAALLVSIVLTVLTVKWTNKRRKKANAAMSAGMDGCPSPLMKRSRDKTISGGNMDIQDAKQLYKKASDLINELFHKSAFLQHEARDASPEERNQAAKNIVEKSPLLGELFCILLELFEVRKIKNVNMEHYTSEDIFNGNANKIVNSLCLSSDKDIDFYKYNTYAFYIITCDVLKTMSRFEQFNGNSLWFFESIYRDIKSLLTMYCNMVAKKKFDGADISCVGKTYRNNARQEINILLGIRHLLYGGTACDAPSTDSPNIAVFALRNYIEFWLRENFNAYMIADTFIPVSKIFSVLRKNISEIQIDPVASNLKNIISHIETLSVINTWTNTYVHSRGCGLFWMPHIILKYLNFVSDQCQKAYTKSSGIYLLFPPFIPKQASVYMKICREIQSPDN